MANLETLTDAELAAEMKRRQAEKDKDRITYKELIDEAVPRSVEMLMELNEAMQMAKVNIYSDFEKLLSLKHEVFKVSDDQQSHQFSTEKYQIKIGYRVYDRWDDTFTAGVSKVNEYINSLSVDDEKSAETIALLRGFMKQDKNGNLKPSRVLELRNMADKINSEILHDGLSIIEKSHRLERSDWFIEAAYRNDKEEWISIPLSMSAIKFPEDFHFSFSPNITV